MRPVFRRSYGSQDSLEGIFGLGAATQGTVEILWPGGTRNRLYDVRRSERVMFPEIPCSYAAAWPAAEAYHACVDRALDELVHKGVLSEADGRAFGTAPCALSRSVAVPNSVPWALHSAKALGVGHEAQGGRPSHIPLLIPWPREPVEVLDRNHGSFRGSLPRDETGVLDEACLPLKSLALLAWLLACDVSLLALAARRLHDIGISARWLLPILGAWFLVIFVLLLWQPSTQRR